MSQFHTRNKATLPYEKCLRYGAGSLNDVELLAVLIRNGTKDHDCLDVAEAILRLCGPMGILGLHHLSTEALKDIPGIGEVKAIMLTCISELCYRIFRTSREEQKSFNGPEDIVEAYREELRHLEKEQFMILMLDTRNHLIHESVLSKGTVNYTCVSTREVFKEALKFGAVSIVLLHNHPSGDPTPSQADIQATHQIRDAGRLIGIPLIDHIVIGDPYYISMKEQNLLEDPTE